MRLRLDADAITHRLTHSDHVEDILDMVEIDAKNIA